MPEASGGPAPPLPSRPEYGYRAAGQTHDAEYVVGPVLALCRALGARRILDIGCGNGEFCRRLAAEGFQPVGIDPSASGILIARQSVPGVAFEQLGVEDDLARLGPADFDAVVSMEVIEHLYAPRQLLQFAKSALKPGGRLIVTTPYHGYLKNLTVALLNRSDSHWLPLWDGGHIKFWSRKTLTTLVDEEGFECTQFIGVGRVAGFWKSMVLVCRPV